MMGTWGGWSTCEDSCSARDGTGNQVRARSPDRAVANGGADCTEDTSEEQSCDTECPGNDAIYKDHHFKVSPRLGVNYILFCCVIYWTT